MEEVRAYYDGNVFVPIGVCNLKKGTEVDLVIRGKAKKEREIARKLAELDRISRHLKELDETEPLTEVFYQSLEEGLKFRELDF